MQSFFLFSFFGGGGWGEVMGQPAVSWKKQSKHKLYIIITSEIMMIWHETDYYFFGQCIMYDCNDLTLLGVCDLFASKLVWFLKSFVFGVFHPS